MIPVTVIGTGVSQRDLTEHHRALICEADCLAGGRRCLEGFPDLDVEKRIISKDIPGLVEWIRERMINRNVVVLASGDPLFFGIGTTLIREIGKENLVVYPNVTSIAAGFAAIKEPWQNAGLVSFHGREGERFKTELETRDLIAVLTDQTHTPAVIAQELIALNETRFSMWVLERLGTPDQTLTLFENPEDVENKTFRSPNIIILKRQPSEISSEAAPPRSLELHPGMPDEAFCHEKGLITKSEIRCLSLAKLILNNPSLTLWDIGAGSGSVSIEASVFLKTGKIIAVEKNPKRIEQITLNKKRFSVTNLSVVQGAALDVVATLPAPDRVFIGGGGRELPDIIREAGNRLKASGVVVVNTVLAGSMDLAITAFKSMNYQTEAVQVQIARSREMPFSYRFEALNPVWIITGTKPKETF